jgi:acetyl esterase/lipase
MAASSLKDVAPAVIITAQYDPLLSDGREVCTAARETMELVLLTSNIQE